MWTDLSQRDFLWRLSGSTWCSRNVAAHSIAPLPQSQSVKTAITSLGVWVHACCFFVCGWTRPPLELCSNHSLSSTSALFFVSARNPERERCVRLLVRETACTSAPLRPPALIQHHRPALFLTRTFLSLNRTVWSESAGRSITCAQRTVKLQTNTICIHTVQDI